MGPSVSILFIFALTVGFSTWDNFSNVEDKEGGSEDINRLWLVSET